MVMDNWLPAPPSFAKLDEQMREIVSRMVAGQATEQDMRIYHELSELRDSSLNPLASLFGESVSEAA